METSSAPSLGGQTEAGILRKGETGKMPED
jgi:hypothetical protein